THRDRSLDPLSIERPLRLHARQQHALLVAEPVHHADSVSNTIVARLSGCQAGQGSSGVAGLPVRANASQALLIRSATRCGSGPLPTMEADLPTLSNTRARSSECGLCHFPPSTGVCQSSSY